MHIKIMDKNLCRICAKNIKEGGLELFNSENKILLLKIKDLTGVELNNDEGFPKLICSVCNSDILRAYKKFREDFLRVQASFKLHITRGNKQQKLHRLTKDREFVQILDVKEEENIAISDSESIFGDEKEINIHKNEVLSFEETYDFLEHNSYEESTLEDSDNAIEYKLGAKLEYNIDKIDTLSDLEVERIRKSDDEFGEPVKIQKDSKKNSEIFICDQCGKQFNSRSIFKQHLIRHSGVKPYACELCPQKFFTNPEVKRHMRKHTGERPYSCKFCGRRFTDCSYRINHERTHTNERPYACQLCGKSFTTSPLLKNHMLTHTGEKEFKCDVCNREFARKTHLDVHFTSKMHKEAIGEIKLGRRPQIKCKTERGYLCPTCSKPFKTYSVVKTHLLTHTGVKNFKCHACNKAFGRKCQLVAHYTTKIHKQAVEKDDRYESQEESKTNMEE